MDLRLFILSLAGGILGAAPDSKRMMVYDVIPDSNESLMYD